MKTSGILAIWNDCIPGKETDYETWYQTEHLFERLSVPGIRRGRRYEALGTRPRYFTYYETDNPEVLTSAAYLARLDDPTPMTAAIMRNGFANMSRTVCRRTFAMGRMRGGHAATIQVPELPSEARLAAWAGSPAAAVTLARLEFWEAVDVDVPQSAEARLRGGDMRVAACVFLESLREAECRAALAHLAGELGVPEGQTGVYRLLCESTAA